MLNDWVRVRIGPVEEEGLTFIAYLRSPRRAFITEGSNTMEVVLLETTNGDWYIVNDDPAVDSLFQRLGPFDKDTGIIHLKLIAHFLPED